MAPLIRTIKRWKVTITFCILAPIVLALGIWWSVVYWRAVFS